MTARRQWRTISRAYLGCRAAPSDCPCALASTRTNLQYPSKGSAGACGEMEVHVSEAICALRSAGCSV
eukprot:6202912-Pleurochrysis_carterae.AAC.2